MTVGVGVGVRQYTLDHLPEGITYNRNTRELTVPGFCADAGEVVLFSPNYESTPDSIAGKWKVCEDGIHLQSGDIIRRISDVAGEFAFNHCSFKIIALNQRNEIREQGRRSDRKKATIAKLSFLLIMMTLVVACILASAYYIQLNQL